MSASSIKSVRRVFEILELFDKERQALPAKEVSRQLKYPLTSAHALLKSMHELGYADYDPETWSYTPSSRLCELLDWIRDLLDRESHIIDFAAALNLATSETVNLSRRVGNKIKILRGLECKHIVGVTVSTGTLMPVTQSLTGIAALSGMNDSQINEFLQRLEVMDAEQARNMNTDILLEKISEVRERGTVAGYDLLLEGIGAVCVPVRLTEARETLIIGVVGPSARIREHEASHRRTIKKLAKQFGVTTVHPLRNPRK